MTSNSSAVPGISPGWLRDPAFDLTLILGVLLLAIATGITTTFHPSLFPVLLALDLWLLGYHHVMSTYTRLAFDKTSFRQHRHLVTTLPLAVLLLTGCIAYLAGAAALATIYLYWQWFHYTRQSEGIARAYAGKAGHPGLMKQTGNRGFFWLMPVTGLVTVSARSPESFLGVPLYTLPVPTWIADGLLVLSAVAILAWLAVYLPATLRGKCSTAWFLFVVSHQVIFLLGYVLITELNHGWLAINVWHNAQYIAFVWLFNTNRFKGQITNEAPMLSYLSRPANVLLYLAVCIALSSSLYISVNLITALVSVSVLPLAIIAYQAINFHHYIVDALIWKLRRPEVSQHLISTTASRS